jgi:hypothetical protein
MNSVSLNSNNIVVLSVNVFNDIFINNDYMEYDCDE